MKCEVWHRARSTSEIADLKFEIGNLKLSFGVRDILADFRPVVASNEYLNIHTSFPTVFSNTLLSDFRER